ncbi:hypothetical protein HG530_004874 [Fusarium avenaceum]|nr:hypothetical protein HG530_004874 [Fusarium avenaceum]
MDRIWKKSYLAKSLWGWCSWSSYRPEVVDQEVENAQNDNEQSSTVLGLESNNHHDTRNATEGRDNDAPERPLATEDKSDEEEDEQNSASQLEVHLAILLVNLRKTSKDLSLANPRVRQDHDQATNDRQVSEEEVQIENKSVAQSLSDDDTHETSDGVVGVLSDDDKSGAGEHGNDVDKEEQSPRLGKQGNAHLTVAVVLEVKQLVGPLSDDTESILKEGDDNQETANGREVAVNEDKGQLSELQTRLQRRSLDSRLDRLADGVERILNLAGIGTNLLEEALALLRVGVLGTTVGSRTTEAVARVESLRHGYRLRLGFVSNEAVSRADLLDETKHDEFLGRCCIDC